MACPPVRGDNPRALASGLYYKQVWLYHGLSACTRRKSTSFSGVDYLTYRYGYTMACPPVRGDNLQALASGLSYVQVWLYHDLSACTWR